MATMTSTSPASLGGTLRAFFDRRLREALKQNLTLGSLKGVLNEVSIPANAGSLSITLFKPQVASTAGIETVTEGTPTPSGYTEVGVGSVNITLTQLREVARTSDLLLEAMLWNWLKQAGATLADNAALKFDTVLRDALVAGFTGSDNNWNEQFAGVANTGTSTTDFSSLSALTKAQGKLTVLEVLRAATQLRNNNVPTVGGHYIAHLAPQGTFDIRQDTTAVTAWQNSDVQKLYRAEIGAFHGVRFIEGTNPFVEDETYNTHDLVDNNGDGLIYSTWVMGANLLGCAKIGSVNGLEKPEWFYLQNADKSDPTNVTRVVGWKSLFGAKVLKTDATGDVRNGVQLRHKSTL